MSTPWQFLRWEVLGVKGKNGSLMNALKNRIYFTLKINLIFLFLKELELFLYVIVGYSMPAHFNSELGLPHPQSLSGSVRAITGVSIQ